MTQVFISYSRKDLSFVEQLARDLKNAGLDVWYDISGIRGGARWRVEIENGLRNSQIAIVVLSPDSVESEWVEREFLYASNLKCKIIPLYYRQCNLPLNYVNLNYIDIQGDNYRKNFDELLRALNQPVQVEFPKSDEAKGYAAAPTDLDMLASQAIRQELQGDFWNSLQTYYKIKRIDPLFPWVDIKIAELEQEIQRERVTLRAKSLQRSVSSLIGIAFLAIVVLAGGLFLVNANRPLATEAPVGTFTSAPGATETSIGVVIPEATDTTIPATPAETPVSAVPDLGGADKIAFVANHEIWMVNVDGSDLKQLTTDGAPKNDLQWLPDGDNIIFISGLTVKFYNIKTGVVDTLASFPAAALLNAFRVSHDGKQVMISLNNEIFVEPFDLNTVRQIHNKSDLLASKPCIFPKGKTESALPVREARWASDDRLVAWLYKEPDAPDQVSVLDIQDCNPETSKILDTFPGVRFTLPNSLTGIISDFDWDGFNQFVFNTSIRNNGWGELHFYNWETHKSIVSVNPSNKKCCYRDARWSPDGSYLLFAFQDVSLGTEAQTLLYYVPVGEIGTGANFRPIPLPEAFFQDPKEAPQPALRSTQ